MKMYKIIYFFSFYCALDRIPLDPLCGWHQITESFCGFPIYFPITDICIQYTYKLGSFKTIQHTGT